MHWATTLIKGARGDQVMWQHVGGWLVFLKNPGKIFLAYGWANTSLNKHPFARAKTSIQTHFHLQSCYPPNKEATDMFFWFMDVQTQAWAISLLHVPKPQSKHIFIFTAATHKQRSNIAAYAPHVGKHWRSKAVCLAWRTNVECASTPLEAELQRSADENTREHKHRVLHGARRVHAQCTAQCTATKRCKYHVFSQK